MTVPGSTSHGSFDAVKRSLARADVHVWSVDVAAHAGREAALRALLDSAERQRADRFHFARDRVQFVVSHGAVRRLLGSYVGRPPETLSFEIGTLGKPELSPRVNDAVPVTFSLSHSGGRALIAVARDRRIGVDIERWSGDIVYDELAAFSFSPAERTALRALPDSLKEQAFFACWSRKEAYIKALGVGISEGLDHFDVTIAPGDGRLLADRHAPGSVANWTMRDLDVGPGYSGAIVAEGGDWYLTRLTLSALPAGDEA